MTAWERAACWVFGGEQSRGTALLPGRTRLDPREALEQVVHERLTAGSPLFIAFSGGRDSSLLLAVALHVARREGLPLPIPVTVVHHGVEGTDESGWQTSVLEHLRATQLWQRVDLHEPAEIVDDIAMAHLRRHGVCWPPAMTSSILRLCAAVPDGAQLINGEGGDEMLGVRRITPVTLAVRRRRVSPALAGAVALALAPRVIRRWSNERTIRHRLGVSMPWLSPDAAKRVIAAHAREDSTEPLDPGRNTLYLARRRAVTVARQHVGLLAREHGVDLTHPLLDERFVSSLLGWGGRGGWTSRSDAIGRIADDLLPRELIMRESKAYFNHTMVGPRAREIARAWGGNGVDPEVIDVESLRAEWLSAEPDGGTYALLQHVAVGMASGSAA